MAIPTHDEIRKPIIKLLTDGGSYRKSDLVQPLAHYFSLSDEEINQTYESGTRSIFLDRISWALSYLAMTDLLLRPKRGLYQLSELGRIFDHRSDSEINTFISQKLAVRRSNAIADCQPGVEVSPDCNSNHQTPQEQLYTSYEAILEEIYDEILDVILSKSPAAFERIVVDLLQKMGYGGAVEKSAEVTQRSRDGGIDGEIKEDVLGLGRIHIQAKRYQRDSTIGRPDIQSFVGALLGNNANKGVFITTAKFSNDAIKYVKTIPSARIILIDGYQLAKYIYQYGLGVQVEQTLSIKKLDSDYWDDLPSHDSR